MINNRRLRNRNVRCTACQFSYSINDSTTIILDLATHTHAHTHTHTHAHTHPHTHACPHTPTHTRTVVAETGIVQLPSKKVPTVEAAKVETEGPKEARTVFVSNLSFKATEDELREIFTPVSVEITCYSCLLTRCTC